MFLGWCFTVSITNMLAQKTCILALLVLISTIIVNKGGDPVNIKQNLSKSLKSYRSLERKSLVDFAEKLSIGKTTLQDIESCKANPTLGYRPANCRQAECQPSLPAFRLLRPI